MRRPQTKAAWPAAAAHLCAMAAEVEEQHVAVFARRHMLLHLRLDLLACGLGILCVYEHCDVLLLEAKVLFEHVADGVRVIDAAMQLGICACTLLVRADVKFVA